MSSHHGLQWQTRHRKLQETPTQELLLVENTPTSREAKKGRQASALRFCGYPKWAFNKASSKSRNIMSAMANCRIRLFLTWLVCPGS